MTNTGVLDYAVVSARARERQASVIGLFSSIACLSPLGWLLAHVMGIMGDERAMMAPVIMATLLSGGLLLLKLLQALTSGIVVSLANDGSFGDAFVARVRAEGWFAMSGGLDEPRAELEAIRGAEGEVAALRAAAEWNASYHGAPRRAEALYEQIRCAPNATPADVLYASHRLIDLYLGALRDPQRVMQELRRMADRFPDTIDGRSALAELRRRRDEGEA